MRRGTFSVDAASPWRLVKQQNTIVICAILGALTTGIYSWYMRSDHFGEALANTPLPAAGTIPRASERVESSPLPAASSPASSTPAETPSSTANTPVRTVPPAPPSERAVAAPSERGEALQRKSGRGASKRDD